MEPTLEPCVQLPPQCSGPCITLAPRRAVSGLAHVGMETGPYPFHHEEGKRGSCPWGGEGPAGPDKGFLVSRCSPVLLSTKDQNGGWGRKGEQGKGHQLEALPLGAPPQGPHG